MEDRAQKTTRAPEEPGEDEERIIRESEEKFRLLFEKATDPTFLMDGNTFVDCNEAALKCMHCPAREQLIGLNPAAISTEMQPDGRPSSEKARELIDTALREGVVRFEWKHRAFNGEDLWVDVSLTVIPIGAKNILYTVWRNITGRKQAEQTLEKEKQRFLALVDNAPFGAVLYDDKGNHVYMNTKFKEIFGYDLRDIPDEKAWFQKAYPDPEYRSQVIAAWQNAGHRFVRDLSLKEGGQTSIATCKDNERKVIHFVRVRLPNGEYLKTCEDITESKKAEEELRNREAELKVKSAKLEEMNAALKVLINEREKDRAELEERIATNVNKLIFPYIDKLKKCRMDSHLMTYVDIIETNVHSIVSPFLQKLGLKCVHLTPTEMRIADLVRSGNTTKQICEALQMAPGAISFHRNNIRKKLGLNNRKVNLVSYLASL